jgi:hypothetical protein
LKRPQRRILPSTLEQGAASHRIGKNNQQLKNKGGLNSCGGKRLSKRTFLKKDPLGPTWIDVQDFPLVEINKLRYPWGLFWDHMRPYLFDKGAYTFPWLVS